ncbi:MAG: galactose mutarotase [Verrucomicrobia bacterium]|nr:galactose mutarotase [Verrucomicrobiota bacterium]
MPLETAPFGHLPNGKPVQLHTLSNRHGMRVNVAEYGLIVTQLEVPDRHGASANVVLGFEHLERYLAGHPHFGAIAGRVANRIAHAQFTLDGQTYPLAQNHGPHHLHGGVRAFDKQLWSARPDSRPDAAAALAFSYTSPHGEEGYPGNLSVTVVYTLTEANELRLDFTATTDRPTPVNLTNHSYFNLAGAGDILGHELWLAADYYTPTDRELIPTGEIRRVKGTPLDFTQPAPIGARYQQTGLTPPGYDHNFVLASGAQAPVLAACVVHAQSGRVLEVLTTEPGIQLYTANGLDGSIVGTGGVPYPRYAGLCLETQHFPDSVHHPHFPSIVLRPGDSYRTTTVFKFSTR